MNAEPIEQYSRDPVFIPLKAEYFEAFERGEKTVEYRPHHPKRTVWLEENCTVGRRVILSYGYGKRRRLNGIIVSYAVDENPAKLKGWTECYGTKFTTAACIGIRVIR
jgi:hypothetical protein